jgi:hypothetical protein
MVAKVEAHRVDGLVIGSVVVRGGAVKVVVLEADMVTSLWEVGKPAEAWLVVLGVREAVVAVVGGVGWLAEMLAGVALELS